jgi:hypothetical protein
MWGTDCGACEATQRTLTYLPSYSSKIIRTTVIATTVSGPKQINEDCSQHSPPRHGMAAT